MFASCVRNCTSLVFRLENCSFSGNHITSGYGACVLFSSELDDRAAVSVRASHFQHSSSGEHVGGLAVRRCSTAEITDSLFYNNTGVGFVDLSIDGGMTGAVGQSASLLRNRFLGLW